MRLLLIASFFVMIPCIAFSQTTWYVPDDFTTIQEAIDNAADGDTIIVRAGTYTENLDFLGKNLVLESESGPVDTVIDGGNHESVVRFVSGEGNTTVLRGFTLTYGWGYDGGGVFCENSAPRIENNIIRNCQANYGGAISVLNSGEITISGNIIEDNYAWLSGGGIGLYTVLHADIKDNVIMNNVAQSQIGGIECQVSECSLINNIIAFNEAQLSNGGGIACIFFSTLFSINDTIVGNSAGFQSGGVGVDYESDVTLVNAILWDNTAYYGEELFVTNGSTLTISYSDVKGGMASSWVDGSSTLNWGSGMIDAHPLFVDQNSGDLHLTWDSPCKDTGDNSASGLPAEDYEGDPRISDGFVDMGADEFHTHLYLTGDTSPGGSAIANLVGAPGTSPVGLFFGSGVLATPAGTVWGPFWLQAPWFLVPLPAMPSSGVMVLSAVLPASPSAPYDLPMQALIGLDPDSLTNLSVLQVR
jgi:hypothetical protein